MNEEARLDSALRRDRMVVMAGLAGVTILGWAYLVHLSRGMADMGIEEQATLQMWGWETFDVTATFSMWVVMMVAMMLPSATPAVLLFTAINGEQNQRNPFATAVFVLGYLAAWVGFSAAATLAQWGLHTAVMLSPDMGIGNPIAGGAILVVAGLFQWTPLKHVCLSHCRSPQGFFMTEWRDGARGAFRMGLRHGGYCVGCCWLLMCILFVAGVMNLAWVAVIAAFILAEKVSPAGQWVSRAAGTLLTGWGVWMTLGGF
jgi:predicted metal-binding membrane protein